jgi:hypothetical protein
MWQNLFTEEPKEPKRKSEKRKPDRKPAVTDSPITFIKMPASPYTFQRGVGFVSPPSQFPIFNFLSSLAGGTSGDGEQQPRSAEAKVDSFEEADRASDTGSGLFGNSIAPETKQPLLKRHDGDDDDAASSVMSQALKNLFTQPQKEIVRPDIKFVSNGRPFNVFDLGTALFKTPETTTTTTEETSTEVDASSEEEKVDSPITWLGKFMLNGLPTKLFDFKSPFSNLDWFGSLKEFTQPSTNLFMSLFK